LGCQNGRREYYLVGSREDKRIARELFLLLEQEQGEARVVLVKQISDLLQGSGYREKQILFLTQYAEKNPADPYNSYYIALVADAYEEMGAIPFAIHYYERILKNYPDVTVMGSSIHFHSLGHLLRYVDNPEYRIEYYKEMISRFSNLIDIGAYYYYLAGAYEEVGAWDLSMQAYKQFLNYTETRIAGHADVHREVSEKVAFYDSNKSWTVPDLQTLVDGIKSSVRRKDVAKLKNYQAKVNFFAKYWEQKKYDETRAKFFNIEDWLIKSRVYVDDELESASNAREAYLRSRGWRYYFVDTWYFYFRKIDFPADPNIDGHWEWAGIYFGEKG
jgi:tetratricopeptide (TPR) repeat protein